MADESERRSDPAHVVECPDEPVRGRPRVELIHHAMDRLEERGISVEEVIAAIRQPDQEGLPTDAGRQRVRKLLGPRHALDVTFEELPEAIRVITAYVRTARPSGRF